MPTIKLNLDLLKQKIDTRNGRIFSGLEASLDIFVHASPGSMTLTDNFLAEYAEKWNWELDAVISFFEDLKTRKLIKISPTSILEVVNAEDMYDDYVVPPVKKRDMVKPIVDLYNLTFGRNMTMSDSRVDLIYARIREGQRFKMPGWPTEQFKAVFVFKKNKWENDDDMKDHLVLETLCAKKHFFKYLDEAREDWKKKNQLKKQASASVS